MFDYNLKIEKSYETKLKMSNFCREWPSICWSILKVNKLVKTTIEDNELVEPWINKSRELWMIFLILILATINLLIILRRTRNNKLKETESRLQQEERHKYFNEIMVEMQEAMAKAETLKQYSEASEEEIQKFVVQKLSNSLTDCRETAFNDEAMQLNINKPRKALSGLTKSKNKTVRFREIKANAETSNHKLGLLNAKDETNSTNAKTKKSMPYNNKKSSISNIPVVQPGDSIKVRFKGNGSQSQAVSLRVTERPLWRI